MKEYRLKQCRLTKKTKDGHTEQVSWIPVQFAKRGKFVKLHDEDGWEVISVGEHSISNKYLKDLDDAVKNQRKASDI